MGYKLFLVSFLVASYSGFAMASNSIALKYDIACMYADTNDSFLFLVNEKEGKAYYVDTDEGQVLLAEYTIKSKIERNDVFNRPEIILTDGENDKNNYYKTANFSLGMTKVGYTSEQFKAVLNGETQMNCYHKTGMMRDVTKKRM